MFFTYIYIYIKANNGKGNNQEKKKYQRLLLLIYSSRHCGSKAKTNIPSTHRDVKKD